MSYENKELEEKEKVAKDLVAQYKASAEESSQENKKLCGE